MNKTYCFSDLHGMKVFWDSIKEIMDETDKAYCLGDVIDRGEDGYDMAKEILEDPRIIYLKGNHEDMFVNSARRTIARNKKREDLGFAFCKAFEIHYYNGGESTEIGWFADKCPEDIINKLDNLPYYATYINKNGFKIFLSHAGLEYPFEETIDKLDAFTKNDLLWDRDHYLFDWPEDTTYDIMIHGHTPIPYVDGAPKNLKNMKPYVYCDNHKIAIDTGCFDTGEFIVLDLDTFEYIHIS